MLTSAVDILPGSRLARATSQMPALRWVGNVFFARLLSWITGRTITDTVSGMRIFCRSALSHLGDLPDGLDFTPIMNTSLTTVHLMPPFRNNLLPRVLLRQAVIKNLWLLGVLLILAACVLNHEGIYAYFTLGKVFIHWSYVLTGSLLFLLGLLFPLWSSLVRVVLALVSPKDPSAGGSP